LNPYLELLRNREDRTAENIELAMAWDEAVSMAYTERTGFELGPGERYSADDARRAEEIIRLFPKQESA
jgi:hypothetical protein